MLQMNLPVYQNGAWAKTKWDTTPPPPTGFWILTDLGDLLVVFVEGLAVFPVEESSNAHDFLLLVDDGQRQDVLDDKTRLVHRFFLGLEKTRQQSRCDAKRTDSRVMFDTESNGIKCSDKKD